MPQYIGGARTGCCPCWYPSTARRGFGRELTRHRAGGRRRERVPSAAPAPPRLTKTWGCGGRCPPPRRRAAGATAPPSRRHEGGDRPRQGFAPEGPGRRRHGCLWRRWPGAVGRCSFLALLRAKPGPRVAGDTPLALFVLAPPPQLISVQANFA